MLMQDSLVAHQGWCAPFFKTPALVESYNKLGASPDKQPEKKKIQKTQSRKTTIQQKAKKKKKKTHGKSTLVHRKHRGQNGGEGSGRFI